MRKVVVLSLLLFSSLGLAEDDHGIGKISTDELDLSYIDHVLAGRVGDRPVFAKPLEGEFGLYVFHRAGGENYETTLRRVDGDIIGNVVSQTCDGEALEEQFTIDEYSADNGTLSGRIGEKHYFVEVTSDTMNGHHYVNPHFAITMDDNFTYEFVIQDSQACMGCIMKISYAVISMLYSYGTL